MDTKLAAPEETPESAYMALITEEPVQPGPGQRSGPPTLYSRQLAAEICARVADGETLNRICRDDHMPVKSAIGPWTARHPDFRAALDHARSLQGDSWGEGAVDEALAAFDKESAMVARVRSDVLLRAAARRAPQTWGEARDKQGPVLNVTINSNLADDRPAIAGEYTIAVDVPEPDDIAGLL